MSDQPSATKRADNFVLEPIIKLEVADTSVNTEKEPPKK